MTTQNQNPVGCIALATTARMTVSTPQRLAIKTCHDISSATLTCSLPGKRQQFFGKEKRKQF